MDWYSRFDQNEVWIDNDGNKTPIAHMSPRYARNILVFIERHNEGIARAAANALMDVPLPSAGTHAYDEVSASADAETAAILADPTGWLAQTPLVQALTDRAASYIGRHVRRLPQPV
ncbi:hypothetical protein [Planomonospora algeriensis]